MKKEVLVILTLIVLLLGCSSLPKEKIAKKTSSTTAEKGETTKETVKEAEKLSELEPLDELPPVDAMADSLKGTEIMNTPNKIPRK
jgi:PBP1b-binding outer membrane lipoprotein LpoB